MSLSGLCGRGMRQGLSSLQTLPRTQPRVVSQPTMRVRNYARTTSPLMAKAGATKAEKEKKPSKKALKKLAALEAKKKAGSDGKIMADTNQDLDEYEMLDAIMAPPVTRTFSEEQQALDAEIEERFRREEKKEYIQERKDYKRRYRCMRRALEELPRPLQKEARKEDKSPPPPVGLMAANYPLPNNKAERKLVIKRRLAEYYQNSEFYEDPHFDPQDLDAIKAASEEGAATPQQTAE